ncbi:MAG TPA: hypothetical protein VGE72_20345 [Azospirillum sp.]
MWDEIRAVLEDPQRLAHEYDRRLAEVRDRPRGADALAGFDQKITGLRRGIARLIDGYAERIIDRAEFEPRIGGMTQRLSRLEEERRKAAADAEVESNLALIIGRLEDFADKVHQSLDELDWNGTREIIRSMVRRIEIDGDHVNVVFRIPPPLSEGGESPIGGACPARDNWQHCRGRYYPPRRRHPPGAE